MIDMGEEKKKKKVLDRKASDNVYLHKDFHGALCYGIKYLDDNFGQQATKEYLQQVGKTFFAPLSQALKKEGLSALGKHWNEIFTKESGEFEISYEGDTLILKVNKCPAIAHLVENNQLYTTRYCETTVVVNETVCEQAGYECSCKYEPGKARCVQKFWKP
jgi:hypothetical protein